MANSPFGVKVGGFEHNNDNRLAVFADSRLTGQARTVSGAPIEAESRSVVRWMRQSS